MQRHLLQQTKSASIHLEKKNVFEEDLDLSGFHW